MSQPFDLSQFPDLPPEVVKAFETQQAALEKAQFESLLSVRRVCIIRRKPKKKARWW
jgi:hypothetical protein